MLALCSVVPTCAAAVAAVSALRSRCLAASLQQSLRSMLASPVPGAAALPPFGGRAACRGFTATFVIPSVPKPARSLFSYELFGYSSLPLSAYRPSGPWYTSVQLYVRTTLSVEQLYPMSIILSGVNNLCRGHKSQNGHSDAKLHN